MRLDEDPKNQWIGCVTDSVKWWVWVWPPYGSGEDGKIIPEFNGTVVDEFQKKLLIRRFQRLVGKEWALPTLPIYSESLWFHSRDYMNSGRHSGQQRHNRAVA